MPLYDFKCKICSHEFEGISTLEGLPAVRCPECGNDACEILITGSNYHPFPEGWWEHIATKPLHISSRSQLKEECRKHDCYATYLDPPISFSKRTRLTKSQH
ncbi:MAG: hypothetical protein KKD77_23805 [Gammaproteobacteria bacterium]|nr:hypothetical protein [Gammaproteobacteria bacterium]